MTFEKLTEMARRFLAAAEHGQTLVEYALIIVIISIGTLAAFTFLKNQLVQVFSDIGNVL
jgi:Flp pilus assembly pilin Flp